MRASLVAICVALFAGSLCSAEPAPEQQLRTAFDQDVHALIGTYCAKCHGVDKQKGKISFAPYKTGRDALGGRELWMKALAELTTREMPPEEEKQPDPEERKRLLAWLKGLRRLEPADPGAAAIRRLSKVEYLATVRALFGVDVPVATELPNDSPGESFDNSLSPLLMEKYLLAADEILDRLIMPEQMQRHFLAGQMDAVKAGVADPGKPDGKERRFTQPSEISAMLDIPVEGTYSIRVKAGAEQAGAEPARLGIRFDSQVVGEIKVVARPKYPATYTCTAQLVPGKTRFSVVFMNPLVETQVQSKADTGKADPGKPEPGKQKAAPAAKKTDPAKDKAPEPAAPAVRAVTIESIDLVGPPAKAATDAQRRLFVAMPGKDLGKAEAARKIIEPFAYRAFRRPPYPEEIDGLLKVFALADGQDEDFVDAVKLMLKAVLVSPQFLFRTPEDHPVDGTAPVVPVADHELATRLSYFLWATMPDDELLQLARGGTLHQPAVLEAQVRRMLKDPRSRALAETFAATWLGVDQLATMEVDEKRFPMLTRELRAAMYEEVMAFVENLAHDGGSILDLIDCDYAYMNGLTAKLYGNDAVKGAKMQKVALGDSNRGGLVGMPAVLMVTSRIDRTSPVKRGKWVLQTLFDAAPPPPPPDVAGLEKQDTPANVHLTLRQKTERHRTDPACAACHKIMDPIGFGLENFDALGRWRITDDSGAPVDAIGELPGKQRFASPSDLKRILMARKDEFARIFTAKLLGFALGRRLSGYDEVVVDDLAEAAARGGYRLDALIVAVAQSYPFVNRRAIH